MRERTSKKTKLVRAKEAVAARDAHIAQLGSAQQRLVALFEIGKLLARVDDPDHSITQVVGRLATALRLESAILIVETRGRPLTTLWQAAAGNRARLTEAKAHAERLYRYLVRSGVSASLLSETAVLPLPPTQAGSLPAGPGEYILLPLVVDARQGIFGALQVESSARLDELDLDFLNGVVSQLAVAIDRRAAVAAREALTEAAAREHRLLAELTALMGSSLDTPTLMARLARFAVTHIADACTVELLTERRSVDRVAVAFADPVREAVLGPQAMKIVPQLDWKTPDVRALHGGRPVLVSSFDDALADGVAHDEAHAELLRASGVESVLALPLLTRDGPAGVLLLGRAGPKWRFGPRDLPLAEEIARRAASALDNARLYHQAVRATALRDETLAVVSHDLKNPLAVILMALGEVLHSRGHTERRGSRRQLEAVLRSAQKMVRMVGDLLDSASIDAGTLAVEKERLEVPALITEAAQNMQTLIARAGLRLELAVDPATPPVRADAMRVQQVLANLLGNALKFTPRGGTITLGARPSGEGVELFVRDTGSGIPADELPKIFQRFWQSPGTAAQGSGIGLYVVKGIVEAHGGRVWAESEPGRGSTFFVTLPAATRPVAGAGASSAAERKAALLPLKE